MNNLSWFIYLAEVIPNVAGVFVALGMFTCFCLIGWLMYIFIESDGEGIRDWFKVVWIPFVFFTIVSLVPSTNTMYMIAASEAGETVVTSQEGKEILQDLREVLDAQLENLKKTD